MSLFEVTSEFVGNRLYLYLSGSNPAADPNYKRAVANSAVVAIVQDRGEKVLDRSFDLAKKINSYFQSNKDYLVVVEQGLVAMRHLKMALDAYDFTLSEPLEFKEPTGFFWKLKSPEGNKSYFLGSIHLAPDYLLNFNAKIRKCFQKSIAIGVEIDITREDAKRAVLEQMRTADLNFGKKILDSLTAEEKSRLKGLLEPYLAKNKASIEGLSDDAIILLGAKVLERNISDLGWESGIDLELTKQAKARGMAIKDLEKVEDYRYESDEFTLKLICELKEPLEVLEKALSDKMRANVSKSVQIWELGDLKALEEMVQSDSLAEKAKLLKRNIVMALKMDDYIQTGERHFFVAGAIHSLGDFGILKILQHIGYTFTRIN